MSENTIEDNSLEEGREYEERKQARLQRLEEADRLQQEREEKKLAEDNN